MKNIRYQRQSEILIVIDYSAYSVEFEHYYVSIYQF